MEKLTDEQIAEALEAYPDWTATGGGIQRTYQFDDFVQSIAFVNRVADTAETTQHHPDILIRYNMVTLTVSTHDAGGVTDKDFALARSADQLASPQAR